jgi:hypothetical protein
MCWKGAVQSWRGPSYKSTSNVIERGGTTMGTETAYELGAAGTEVRTTVPEEQDDDEIRQASEHTTEPAELPAGEGSSTGNFAPSDRPHQGENSIYELEGAGEGKRTAWQPSQTFTRDPRRLGRHPDGTLKANEQPPGSRMPLPPPRSRPPPPDFYGGLPKSVR